ncbi:hypothetical protein EXU57_11030 [Segetibacter sp. 3557_3]|uniref:hypothetical protein n=1 Tax=Segetibacter sp. 3557_3 TaxID=2547429 RepID=UPI0010588B16|nr:hypothetical protein [Segetibacter sp. 3557_3]TDH26614.1 hypothetical protein EXU57_11030 [Segetibacter sp. 3557_3]
MVTNITAGVIGCSMKEEFFATSVHNEIEKFHWKKVHSTKAAPTHLQHTFPDTEVVDSVQAIVNDQDISLVFVSSDHLREVPVILEAGKAVRII